MRSVGVAFLLAMTNAHPVLAVPIEMLTNGGFETGDLTGWVPVTVPGNVVTATGASGCQAINPGTPRTGSFLYTACSVDGVTPGTPDVTIAQIADAASIASVAQGLALVSASGYASGAEGCATSSDDVIQATIRFLDASLATIGTATSVPMDPTWGVWNPVVVAPVPSPVGTEKIVLELQCRLDPGFASIDIGLDDFSLIVDTPDPTAAPEPRMETSSWGKVKSGYSEQR
jgi:hypothetical protein